jgi:hypothetical protein
MPAGVARAPEQVVRSVHAGFHQVIDHALQRCEAGAPADEQARARRLLVEDESAERPLDAQQRALLHLVEGGVGEAAAGDLLDVQHEVLVVVRGVGQRVAAPLATLQQDVEILAGEKLQALGRRKLQAQLNHVGRQLRQRGDAAG